MNKQEAIQILQQALSQVKATVQEHNIINQALQVVTTPEQAPVVEEEEKKEE